MPMEIIKTNKEEEMNKNYNKFFNKNENAKPESEVEEKVCNEEECENCTCETPSQPTQEPKNLNRQVGNCEYLNLREAPNKQSEVLSIIKRGTTLTLLEPIIDDDKWVKVRIHKTGVEGFIMRDYTI
jgi:uncharacterized protein YgiM (DUF1202 family)